MGDDCSACLFGVEVPEFTEVGPPPETLVGGVRVWELRQQSNAVVPEGTEKIGGYWFWGSRI